MSRTPPAVFHSYVHMLSSTYDDVPPRAKSSMHHHASASTPGRRFSGDKNLVAQLAQARFIQQEREDNIGAPLPRDLFVDPALAASTPSFHTQPLHSLSPEHELSSGRAGLPPVHPRRMSVTPKQSIGSGAQIDPSQPLSPPTTHVTSPKNPSLAAGGRRQSMSRVGLHAPASTKAPAPASIVVRKFRIHGRFHLWTSGILLCLALCHQILGLVTDHWIDLDDKDHAFAKGKETLQWILVSCAILSAAVAHILLIARFSGWRIADVRFNAVKLVAIFLLACNVVFVTVATRLYTTVSSYTDSHPPVANVFYAKGASYNFVADSIWYIIVCIVLLTYHEIDEHLRERHQREARKKTIRQREKVAVTTSPSYVHTRSLTDSEETDLEKATSTSSPPTHPQTGPPLNPSHSPSATTEKKGRFSVVLHHDYLSPPQRRLVYAVSIFFILIYGGGVMFAYIEGWNIRIASDFCIVLISTIGYGNVTPQTIQGQIILFIYFPIGFASLGFTVNLVWQVLLAKLNSRVRRASNALASNLPNHPCLRRLLGIKEKHVHKPSEPLKPTSVIGSTVPPVSAAATDSTSEEQTQGMQINLLSASTPPGKQEKGEMEMTEKQQSSQPYQLPSIPSTTVMHKTGSESNSMHALTQPSFMHKTGSESHSLHTLDLHSGSNGQLSAGGSGQIHTSPSSSVRRKQQRPTGLSRSAPSSRRGSVIGPAGLAPATNLAAAPSMFIPRHAPPPPLNNVPRNQIFHASPSPTSSRSANSEPHSAQERRGLFADSALELHQHGEDYDLELRRREYLLAHKHGLLFPPSSPLQSRRLHHGSASLYDGMNSMDSADPSSMLHELSLLAPGANNSGSVTVVPRHQPSSSISQPGLIQIIGNGSDGATPASSPQHSRVLSFSHITARSSAPTSTSQPLFIPNGQLHHRFSSYNQSLLNLGLHDATHEFEPPHVDDVIREEESADIAPTPRAGSDGTSRTGLEERLTAPAPMPLTTLAPVPPPPPPANPPVIPAPSPSSLEGAARFLNVPSTAATSAQVVPPTARRAPLTGTHSHPHHPLPLSFQHPTGAHTLPKHCEHTDRLAVYAQEVARQQHQANQSHAPAPATLTASMTPQQRKTTTTGVQLLLAFCFVCLWILGSAAIFVQTEGWTYFRSIYFCYITLATIGFGDLYPTRSSTSAFFLWFVIFGLGAVIYVLSLVGEILQQRFEERILKRQKFKAAKARRKAALKEIETQEMIFAPPTTLLEHAEEFSTYTNDLVEKAKNAMAQVKAHTELFDVGELQRYQLAYSSLIRAEERRRQTFEQAWMKAMQHARTAGPKGGQIQDVHSPGSQSEMDFDWSRGAGPQSHIDMYGMDTGSHYPFYHTTEGTAGHHRGPSSMDGIWSPQIVNKAAHRVVLSPQPPPQSSIILPPHSTHYQPRRHISLQDTLAMSTTNQQRLSLVQEHPNDMAHPHWHEEEEQHGPYVPYDPPIHPHSSSHVPHPPHHHRLRMYYSAYADPALMAQHESGHFYQPGAGVVHRADRVGEIDDRDTSDEDEDIIEVDPNLPDHLGLSTADAYPIDTNHGEADTVDDGAEDDAAEEDDSVLEEEREDAERDLAEQLECEAELGVELDGAEGTEEVDGTGSKHD